MVCRVQVELQAEFLAQVLKQHQRNPSQSSRAKCIELVWLCAHIFPIPATAENHIVCFLMKEGAVGKKVIAAIHRAKYSKCVRMPPNGEEQQAMIAKLYAAVPEAEQQRRLSVEQICPGPAAQSMHEVLKGAPTSRLKPLVQAEAAASRRTRSLHSRQQLESLDETPPPVRHARATTIAVSPIVPPRAPPRRESLRPSQTQISLPDPPPAPAARRIAVAMHPFTAVSNCFLPSPMLPRVHVLLRRPTVHTCFRIA